MHDPATLSATAIGAAALTEGIKFLYSQTGEILKRWRKRRDKVRQETKEEADKTEPLKVALPEVFEGKLDNPEIHFWEIQMLENELRELRRELSDYAEEIEDVDETDPNLLKKVDALRNLLEAVYHQSITFKGEKRQPSGSPIVIGMVEAKEIAGEAIGVEVKAALSGEIKGTITADRIEQDGRVTGVKVSEIGVTKASKKRPRE